MFDFDVYMPDWDGDWCGTGPHIPLPLPGPDPAPLELEANPVLDLEDAGLWPFPDKPVETTTGIREHILLDETAFDFSGTMAQEAASRAECTNNLKQL